MLKFIINIFIVALIVVFAGVAQATATTEIAQPEILIPEPLTTDITPPTCNNMSDLFLTNCQLTWNGVTVYGIVDVGGGWQSHAAPFNRLATFGTTYFVQRNGRNNTLGLAPNALYQSNIGIKGSEKISPDWSIIFDLSAGFDPYSLELANGTGSVFENRGTPLTQQTTYGDSSRAGQFYNGLGYIGVSSKTYGTLTFLRQNTLTLDGVFNYDPMGASYAFSPIGWQGIACGAGDPENCRATTSTKYRVNINQLRLAGFAQMGGYKQNNASNGEFEGQVGGDIPNLANGTLSLDAIYSWVRDAVNVTINSTLPTFPMMATISDNTSAMLLSKYVNGIWKFYAGYEWIQYAPPSDPQTQFTNIAGECVGTMCFNNTIISNISFSPPGNKDRILQIFWTGARITIVKNLDLVGAYYHYLQNNYAASATNLATCSANSENMSFCKGTMNAFSGLIDWRFLPKWDTYFGMMYSQVNGGLASGFLHRSNFDPTVGIAFHL